MTERPEIPRRPLLRRVSLWSVAKWIGPTVESQIDELGQAGIKDVLLVPVGFVSDHVEILYDIDVLFHDYGKARGVRVRRSESLNDSAKFASALASLVTNRIGIVASEL